MAVGEVAEIDDIEYDPARVVYAIPEEEVEKEKELKKRQNHKILLYQVM